MKSIAFTVAFTFLVTNLGVSPNAFAAGGVPFVPEVTLPYQAILDQNLRMAIPRDLGKIEDLHFGKGPAVFHIQTAHGHYEAQQQIRQILHHLNKNYGVKTVLVEGSAFKLNPEILNFFPDDKKLTKKVNDVLTRAALVKGPELYLLDEIQDGGMRRADGDKQSAPSSILHPSSVVVPQAFGIENAEAYRANRESFVSVLNEKEKTKQFLSDMDVQIERLASQYLNKDLRDFLKRLETFEKNQIPFDAWLAYIRGETQKRLSVDLSSPAHQIEWPMLVRVFKTQELSAKLDRQKFPKERDEFLKALRRFLPGNGKRATGNDAFSVPRSPFTAIEELLRSDSMSQQLPDPETSLLFEDMVKQLPQDFNYDRFPNVRYFIGTLLLQSELKADRLMLEVQKLSGVVAEKLTRNMDEKKLVALLADHRLLQKLFALELTPEDYEIIIGRRREEGGRSLKPSSIVDHFKDAIRHPSSSIQRVKAVKFDHVKDLDALYERAMKFYEGVKERDQAMEEMVEKRLTETGADRVAVITGGFHSQPFKDYFSGKGYTYALISPKLTGADEAGHEAYINNMLRMQDSRGRMADGDRQSAPSSSTIEDLFLSDSYASHALAHAAFLAGQQVSMTPKQTRQFAQHLKEAAGIAPAGLEAELAFPTAAQSAGKRSEARQADVESIAEEILDTVYAVDRKAFGGAQNRPVPVSVVDVVAKYADRKDVTPAMWLKIQEIVTSDLGEAGKITAAQNISTILNRAFAIDVTSEKAKGVRPEALTQGPEVRSEVRNKLSSDSSGVPKGATAMDQSETQDELVATGLPEVRRYLSRTSGETALRLFLNGQLIGQVSHETKMEKGPDLLSREIEVPENVDLYWQLDKYLKKNGLKGSFPGMKLTRGNGGFESDHYYVDYYLADSTISVTAKARAEVRVSEEEIARILNEKGLTFGYLRTAVSNQTMFPEVGLRRVKNHSTRELSFKDSVAVSGTDVKFSRISAELLSDESGGTISIQARLYAGAMQGEASLLEFRIGDANDVQFARSDLSVPTITAMVQTLKTEIDQRNKVDEVQRKQPEAPATKHFWSSWFGSKTRGLLLALSMMGGLTSLSAQTLQGISGSQDVLQESLKAQDKKIDELIRNLKAKDSYARFFAGYDLAGIGLPAVPALIETLKDPDEVVRAFVVGVLGKINHKQVLPALIGALGDRENVVRAAAADALRNVGDKQAIPALIKALSDKEYIVRYLAKEALVKIGQDAVPALIKALGERDENARGFAAKALDKIGWKPSNPAEEEAYNAAQRVPQLPAYIKQYFLPADLLLLGAIAAALGAVFGPDLGPALTAVKDFFLERDFIVSGMMAVAIGIAAQEIRNAYFPAKKKTEKVGKEGASVKSSESKENMSGKLLSVDPFLVVVGLVVALGTGVVASFALVHMLFPIRRHIFWINREEHRDALVKIGVPAVPALLKALNNDWSEVRRNVVVVLGRIGPVTPEVVPAIWRALEDKQPDVRAAAAVALGNVGAGMPKVVPALTLILLGDKEYSVRDKAAEALDKLDALSRELKTKRYLFDLEEKISAHVRLSAAEALGDASPLTPGVVPALIRAMNDEWKPVRIAAAESLKKIRSFSHVEAKETEPVSDAFRATGSRALNKPVSIRQYMTPADWLSAGAVAAILGSIMLAVIDLDFANPVFLGISAMGVSVAAFFILWRVFFPVSWHIWRSNSSDDDNRLEAENALVEIGIPAIESLTKALKSKHWEVRQTAANVLGRIGDRLAVEPLIRALEDVHWEVRDSAAKALGRIADPKAEGALVRALGGASHEVRVSAQRALFHIRDKQSTETSTTGYSSPEDLPLSAPSHDRAGNTVFQEIVPSVIRELKRWRKVSPKELFEIVQSRVPISMEGLTGALEELQPLSGREILTANEITEAITRVKRKYKLSGEESKILRLALNGDPQNQDMDKAIRSEMRSGDEEDNRFFGAQLAWSYGSQKLPVRKRDGKDEWMRAESIVVGLAFGMIRYNLELEEKSGWPLFRLAKGKTFADVEKITLLGEDLESAWGPLAAQHNFPATNFYAQFEGKSYFLKMQAAQKLFNEAKIQLLNDADLPRARLKFDEFRNAIFEIERNIDEFLFNDMMTGEPHLTGIMAMIVDELEPDPATKVWAVVGGVASNKVGGVDKLSGRFHWVMSKRLEQVIDKCDAFLSVEGSALSVSPESSTKRSEVRDLDQILAEELAEKVWGKIAPKRRGDLKNFKEIPQAALDEVRTVIVEFQKMLTMHGKNPPSQEEILDALLDANVLHPYKIANQLPPTLVFRGAIFRDYAGPKPYRIAVTIGEDVVATNVTHTVDADFTQFGTWKDSRRLTHPLSTGFNLEKFMVGKGGSRYYQEGVGELKEISIAEKYFGVDRMTAEGKHLKTKQLLTENADLSRGMNAKSPPGDVPWWGGKSLVLVRKGADKKKAFERWVASSITAGFLGQRYLAGPDMGTADMMSVIQNMADRVHGDLGMPLARVTTSIIGEDASFRHQDWTVTSITGMEAFLEVIRNVELMRQFGFDSSGPIDIVIQGFGDVGAGYIRYLRRQYPELFEKGRIRIVGISNIGGGIYDPEGLNVGELLRLNDADPNIDLFASYGKGEKDEAVLRKSLRKVDRGDDIYFVRQLFPDMPHADEPIVGFPAANPGVIKSKADIDRLVAAKVKILIACANNFLKEDAGLDVLLESAGILFFDAPFVSSGGINTSGEEIYHVYTEGIEAVREMKNADPDYYRIHVQDGITNLIISLTRRLVSEYERSNRRQSVTQIHEDLARKIRERKAVLLGDPTSGLMQRVNNELNRVWEARKAAFEKDPALWDEVALTIILTISTELAREDVMYDDERVLQMMHDLGNGDDLARRIAIYELGRKRHYGVEPRLVEILTDERQGFLIRSATAEALGHLNFTNALSDLIAVRDLATLRSSETGADEGWKHLRVQAQWSINKMSSLKKEQATAFEFTPQTKGQETEFQKAMKDLQPPKGWGLFKDRVLPAVNRAAAARVLGRLKDPRAVLVLTLALSDKEEIVRNAADGALKSIEESSIVRSEVRGNQADEILIRLPEGGLRPEQNVFDFLQKELAPYGIVKDELEDSSGLYYAVFSKTRAGAGQGGRVASLNETAKQSLRHPSLYRWVTVKPSYDVGIKISLNGATRYADSIILDKKPIGSVKKIQITFESSVQWKPLEIEVPENIKGNPSVRAFLSQEVSNRRIDFSKAETVLLELAPFKVQKAARSEARETEEIPAVDFEAQLANHLKQPITLPAFKDYLLNEQVSKTLNHVLAEEGEVAYALSRPHGKKIYALLKSDSIEIHVSAGFGAFNRMATFTQDMPGYDEVRKILGEDWTTSTKSRFEAGVGEKDVVSAVRGAIDVQVRAAITPERIEKMAISRWFGFPLRTSHVLRSWEKFSALYPEILKSDITSDRLDPASIQKVIEAVRAFQKVEKKRGQTRWGIVTLLGTVAYYAIFLRVPNNPALFLTLCLALSTGTLIVLGIHTLTFVHDESEVLIKILEDLQQAQESERILGMMLKEMPWREPQTVRGLYYETRRAETVEGAEAGEDQFKVVRQAYEQLRETKRELPAANELVNFIDQNGGISLIDAKIQEYQEPQRRSESRAATLAVQLGRKWDKIRNDGLFVFDMQKTLVERKGILTDGLRDSLIWVLSEGVPMVVISANSREEVWQQLMEPLLKGLRAQKKLSVAGNILVYANSGTSKYWVDRKGERHLDVDFSEQFLIGHRVEVAVREGLKALAKKGFFISPKEFSAFREIYEKDRTKDGLATRFLFPWMENNLSRAFYKPSIVVRLKDKKVVQAPYIVRRGILEEKPSSRGTALAIRQFLPGQREKVWHALEGLLPVRLGALASHFVLRGGGLSTVDFSNEKANKAFAFRDAVNYFQEKGRAVDLRDVVYHGDEVWQDVGEAVTKNRGNDMIMLDGDFGGDSAYKKFRVAAFNPDPPTGLSHADRARTTYVGGEQRGVELYLGLLKKWVEDHGPEVSSPKSKSRAEVRGFVALAENAFKNSWIIEVALQNIRSWSGPEYARVHGRLDEDFKSAGADPRAWSKINDAWYTKVVVGTAGMRGTLGFGTNRISEYTLGSLMMAHALSVNDPAFTEIIEKTYPEFREKGLHRAVVIAGDSRYGSYDTKTKKPGLQIKLEALINVALGIKAYVFKSPTSTPQLAWAVHELNVEPTDLIVSGSENTASHNPLTDNGNKPYKIDGSQATGVFSDLMTKYLPKAGVAELNALTYDGMNVLENVDVAFERALSQGDIRWVGGTDDDSYEGDAYHADELFVQRELQEAIYTVNGIFDDTRLDLKNSKIVISPLFGVSRHILKKIAKARGLRDDQIFWVEDEPNSNFPEVEGGKPNPEDPKARLVALRKAVEVNADLVLWTDPDADRPAVAAKKDPKKKAASIDDYASFNGNQQLAILMDYLIREMKIIAAEEPFEDDATRTHLAEKAAFLLENIWYVFAAFSLVSADLSKIIARENGLKVVETLVGFKYVGDQIEARSKASQERAGVTESEWQRLTNKRKVELEIKHSEAFLFGGEESLGALSSDGPHDKDALAAVMWFVEIMGRLRKEGKTLGDRLDEIYKTYGYFSERFPMLEKIRNYAGVEFSEAEAKKIIDAEEGSSIMNFFKDTPPKTIAGKKVIAVLDYYTQVAKDTDGNVLFDSNSHSALITAETPGISPSFRKALGKIGVYSFRHDPVRGSKATAEKLPREKFIRFILEGGSIITPRPSGTESKIKFYVLGRGRLEEKAAVDAWVVAAVKELDAIADGIARECFPEKFRSEVRSSVVPKNPTVEVRNPEQTPILVLNAGSSTVKYQLIDMKTEKVLQKGTIVIGSKAGEMKDHDAAIESILSKLPMMPVAVGHRVVHGGEKFTKSVRITPEVIAAIEKNVSLAPLHNPPNLSGIFAAQKALPNALQVAVFDTAFHQTMPPEAYVYAIPYELYTKYGIRRYGFHGTSHRFVTETAAKLFGKKIEDMNVITIHLGNGASATAVKGGKSIDTSMGLTPLEGLVMGNRSGDLDPAIPLYLQGVLGMSAVQVDNLLNKQSGLKGISGISDAQDLLKAIENGDEKAALARNIFVDRVMGYVATYAEKLDHNVDAIIVTGGIGEHTNNAIQPTLLERLGKFSEKFSGEKPKVVVIPTNEELAIARDTREILFSPTRDERTETKEPWAGTERSEARVTSEQTAGKKNAQLFDEYMLFGPHALTSNVKTSVEVSKFLIALQAKAEKALLGKRPSEASEARKPGQTTVAEKKAWQDAYDPSAFGPNAMTSDINTSAKIIRALKDMQGKAAEVTPEKSRSEVRSITVTNKAAAEARVAVLPEKLGQHVIPPDDKDKAFNFQTFMGAETRILAREFYFGILPYRVYDGLVKGYNKKLNQKGIAALVRLAKSIFGAPVYADITEAAAAVKDTLSLTAKPVDLDKALVSKVRAFFGETITKSSDAFILGPKLAFDGALALMRPFFGDAPVVVLVRNAEDRTAIAKFNAQLALASRPEILMADTVEEAQDLLSRELAKLGKAGLVSLKVKALVDASEPIAIALKEKIRDTMVTTSKAFENFLGNAGISRLVADFKAQFAVSKAA